MLRKSDKTTRKQFENSTKLQKEYESIENQYS